MFSGKIHSSFHPDYSLHSEHTKSKDGANAGRFGTASVSVVENTSLPNPFRAESLHANHSVYTAVQVQGKPGTYFLDPKKSVGGVYELRTYVPETDTYVQAKDKAVPDGRGGWKLDSDSMRGGGDREPLLGGKPKKESSWPGIKSDDKKASDKKTDDKKTTGLRAFLTAPDDKVHYKPLLPPKGTEARMIAERAHMLYQLEDPGAPH
jgi:hypothetical protein